MKNIRGSITNECKKLEWIQEIYPGHWIFKEPISKLLSNLGDYFFKEIGKPLKFSRIIFPKIIPENTFLKYGNSLYPASIALTVNRNRKKAKSLLVLDPALTCFYGSYMDSNIPLIRLPILANDLGLGMGFRNESNKNLKEFYRSVEYYRSDFLFLGTPTQVTKLLKNINILFNKSIEKLDLKIYKTKDTDKVKNQLLESIDFMVDIGKENIEIASTANRKTWVTNNYNIKCAEGNELWSGYLSVGLTRILYCFLATHGFDKTKWPKF
jgi:seryl-tRNA synthetase